jgi:hypothetical protein
MDAQKILDRAASYKKRVHRLSLNLRLRTPAEARRFIRDQGIVLWHERAELPCVLDAILGRIASAQERLRGKPKENCVQWRRQLLKDLDFLECNFFRNFSTVVHQDLWSYLAVCSRANRDRSQDDGVFSRDARRILSYLAAEGACRMDLLRRALKYQSAADNREFQRAVRELTSRLILVARHEPDAPANSRVRILDSLENTLPRTNRVRADSLSEKEAVAKLMSATVNSCVLAAENKLKRWFSWSSVDWHEIANLMIRNRECIRVTDRRGAWLVSRKAT